MSTIADPALPGGNVEQAAQLTASPSFGSYVRDYFDRGARQ
jgi:hypothetical protein